MFTLIKKQNLSYKKNCRFNPHKISFIINLTNKYIYIFKILILF